MWHRACSRSDRCKFAGAEIVNNFQRDGDTTMADKMTRGQVQDLVGKFATENPKYRDALIRDPKGVIEKQLNTSLGNVGVKAVVPTAMKCLV